MLRSGAVIAFFTLISRIFGLARELFVASLFGTTSIADSVNVAFKLPNLFRRIFAEGALSSVFIPIFNSKMQVSETDAKKFAGSIFSLLFITLIILIVLMQIFMPTLMWLIAPGFYLNHEKFELTVLLCRITMPYLIFISIIALFGGMLNSIKKFAAFAFSPVILSIVVILGTVVLADMNVNNAVAISVSICIAGVLQVIFMIICSIKAKMLFLPNLDFTDSGIKKFANNMIPATMSAGAGQLNLFISQSIASFIPGAVSILSYADRIYQFPLSIIGTTFSTLLLPELSKIYAIKDHNQAAKIQNKAIMIGLILSVPAAFGIIVLAVPIIHVIYERGAFSSSDCINTANAISAFSVGLPAFVLSKILTPIFYANHNTQTPFRITIFSLVINTIGNLLLMIPFGHVGIALGSSFAGWCNVWLLFKYAKQHYGFTIENNLGAFVLKLIICCLIMYLAVNTCLNHLIHYAISNSILLSSSTLIGLVLIGAGTFFTTGFILKLHKTLIKA